MGENHKLRIEQNSAGLDGAGIALIRGGRITVKAPICAWLSSALRSHRKGGHCHCSSVRNKVRTIHDGRRPSVLRLQLAHKDRNILRSHYVTAKFYPDEIVDFVRNWNVPPSSQLHSAVIHSRSHLPLPLSDEELRELFVRRDMT